jgi:Flp pilus assembly protein TadG
MSDLKALLACRKGGVALEFALIAPVFLAMLLGVISYGGYFWIAHSVQQLANDAARAAIAGLTQSEREQLAQNTLSVDIASDGVLDAKSASIGYSGDSSGYSISITYDASGSAFWAASGLVPMPSSMVVRRAAIRLGGY